MNFSEDLPQYEPVLHIDGARITQDPLMWLAALDLLLARMKEASFPFGDVIAVSGSGQQHGSVYLGRGADVVLASLDPAAPVAEQLAKVKDTFFTVPFAPIWMDSSTREQCDHLEAAMPDGALQVLQCRGGECGGRAGAAASGSCSLRRLARSCLRRAVGQPPPVLAWGARRTHPLCTRAK